MVRLVGAQVVDEAVVAAATQALAGQRYRRAEAVEQVPRQPGLYAFHGDDVAWSDLGLRPAFAGQPLYAGKAEKSLHNRDVRTHFATGKTGQSTLRRSLAALLEQHLDLVAVPRNREKPDRRASFALEHEGDQRLSDWIEQHLSMAVWVRPEGADLGAVESVVVRYLHPPLNLDKVGEPRVRLRAARKRLADASRAPASGPTQTL